MEDENRYYSNSIFWVEVDRIKPNPFQPRRSFDEANLNSLAESIRQYGVLQPLVVTRHEVETPEGGLRVEYELISGERRLRAAKIAAVQQVPCVIRAKEDSDKAKLELAIIENLQREDLNAVDRAKAFQKLADEFNLNHTEIAKKMGKSREYVSNTLRILQLPEDMQQALVEGKISDGHTRPLLMLSDKQEEQRVLFKEIMDKKMTVREAESVSRRIAIERARKQNLPPELLNLEKELTETLGTRVRIESKEKGGKVLIDFFSQEDLAHLVSAIAARQAKASEMPPMDLEASAKAAPAAVPVAAPTETPAVAADMSVEEIVTDTLSPQEEDDLYSMKNFTL